MHHADDKHAVGVEARDSVVRACEEDRARVRGVGGGAGEAGCAAGARRANVASVCEPVFPCPEPDDDRRRADAENLCVLRVSTEILQIEGVVLADRNAAGGDRWVRFLHPRQWRVLDFDRIYAVDWRDADKFEYFEKKRKKCAEALVPHKVALGYLTGAYVVNDAAARRLAALGFHLPISVDAPSIHDGFHHRVRAALAGFAG